MSLQTGISVGPYQIVAPLGAGGMGEVYRARDPRIARDVALKVLPEAWTTDPERVSRFEREAQVLGSLNHQNIAAIYGIEQAPSSSGASTPVLVMELVEGPTLAERIEDGAIAINDALAIALQIAEALDAAHAAGIVHRDLKPANIKLRADGTVKVLDFGLAKAFESSQVGATHASPLPDSPTITSPAMTAAGMILGTAAYMSPEQAKGKPVDKRADVWAFGAVLYEMLTGRRAFGGEDLSDTLATVLKFDPDWNRLPADTPEPIRRLLKRCLVKDPTRRLRDCGSALLEIRDAQSGESASAPPPVTVTVARSGRSWLLLTAVAAIAAAAGAGAWALLTRTAPAPAPVTRRFAIALPDTQNLTANTGTVVSIAQDGRSLVYRAGRDNKSQLFRRGLEQFDAVPIPATEAAAEQFLSPDGAWILFNENGKLRRLPAQGGPAQTLATLPSGIRGRDWTRDGRLFLGSLTQGGSLIQLAATGGEPTVVFKAPDQKRAMFPQLLPDGTHLLFTLADAEVRARELHVLRLGSSESRTVLEDAAAGRVLPTGHLIFERGGSLWASPFDADKLAPVGNAIPVIEGVRLDVAGTIQFDVADDGTLVYVPGRASDRDKRTLRYVSADERIAPLPVAADGYTGLRLSPDGTRIVAQIGGGESTDVWVVDAARGTLTRITNEPGFDGSAIWSPDGRAVAYVSARDGQWTLYRKAADGTGPSEQIASFGVKFAVHATDWSASGHLIVTVNGDIGVVSADGNEPWKPLLHTAANEVNGVLSPDGRWIAYMSNETGSGQIYLQRFPSLRDRQVVSVGNGIMPTWGRDGKSLTYLRGGPPRDIMRVTLDLPATGPARLASPTKIADWNFYNERLGARYWDVAPDGRLIVIGLDDGDTSAWVRQINVVTNWFEELKRLVPVH